MMRRGWSLGAAPIKSGTEAKPLKPATNVTSLRSVQAFVLNEVEEELVMKEFTLL